MKKKSLSPILLMTFLIFTPAVFAQTHPTAGADPAVTDSTTVDPAMSDPMGVEPSASNEIAAPDVPTLQADKLPQKNVPQVSAPIPPAENPPAVTNNVPAVLEKNFDQFCAVCFKPFDNKGGYEVQYENKIYKTDSVECQKLFNSDPKKAVKKLEFEEEKRRRQSEKEK